MRYTVQAERSGDYWAISVPEVEGVFSQTKRLDHVEAMAREAIALVLDVSEDSLEVNVEVHLSAPLQTRFDETNAAKVEADAAQRNASRAAVALVCRLVDEGLSLRDIGKILGVSHQRVDQLLRLGRQRVDA